MSIWDRITITVAPVVPLALLDIFVMVPHVSYVAHKGYLIYWINNALTNLTYTLAVIAAVSIYFSAEK